MITVSISLPEALKNQGLKYIWHLNSKTGKKLNGTDSVYENSDFIYRPADTEIIPADVTTGKNRVYNRGFKQGYTYVGQYLYLTVETETGTTLGTRVFYVADPQTPPVPNN